MNPVYSGVLRILLIEDNPADAHFLQEILDEIETTRWHISHAERLADGIAQLAHQQFDVILSDLSLPDTQDLETVERLHTTAASLPIIVLTGLDDNETGLEAIRRGAQDYLVKGQFDGNLLIRSIRYAIERSQTQLIMRQQSAAIAACREGIAILNPSQEFIYLNQAYLGIYRYDSSNHLLKKPWHLLLDHEDYSHVADQAFVSLQQHGHWHGEVVCKRADDSKFYAEIFLTAFENGLICTVRDISDRKRSEANRLKAEGEIRKALEREKELNELKSNFVSMVSHEFRTPLTAILSSAQMLGNYEQQLTQEKKQVRLHHIINGARRMTQLLDEVLFIGMAQSGRLQFHPTPLQLDIFCQELIEEYRLIDTTNHAIIFTCSAHQTFFQLDAKLLHHILSNLLSNAIKYSPNKTDIQVKLNCTKRDIIIQVQDSGIGISESDREHLFTPFYRGRNVTNIPGTGLGLAIISQCVELHGGSIEMTSQVNCGTLFIVKLPILNPDV